MDEESTKGKALADVACSLLTPCYHLGDDDDDEDDKGGDLDDDEDENSDKIFENEESENFVSRPAFARNICFHLI